MLSPVIDGIHQGSLVEITAGDETSGQLGQFVSYEDGSIQVAMLETNDLTKIDPHSVRECIGLDEKKSFDVVLGPRTSHAVLGSSMATCLNEKGFCVLKTVQKTGDFETCYSNLKDLESKKMFGRLPQVVEDGFLGKSGRAKTMWMDPMSEDDFLYARDGTMTRIAETLAPFCADKLGCELGERTSGMVCLSMTDEEEDAFLHPEADNQTLLEYHNTWARGKIRLVFFLGPDAGEVTLQPKEGAPISGLEDEYTISASANTIILVREDTFNYGYDEPDEGESVWMQCFLLEPGAEWSVQEFQEEQVTAVLAKKQDGPPPPHQHLVSVTALHLQTAANMVDTYKEWNAYLSGTDGQLEMPISRFSYDGYYDSDMDNVAPGKTYVKHFSVQEGIDMFDNKAFDISISEASALDPMYRQVLECTHVMLNKMGITKKYTNGNPIHASISVGNDKQEWNQMPDVPSSVATNNQLAIAANRVNYIFNLKGGSYVCDTACSSSLVAAHLGKLALLEGRWDPLDFHMAFGTGLTLTIFSFLGSCASHMLSNHGRCLTFNASANGYNRGDGTSGMMLKNGPQDEHRYAYMRGTQMGNDGRSASMSAPNGPAQEKCVWGAIREAQMRPPESTVWECHGTGTSLGDPIEVGAVRKVQIKEPRLEPLMIGTSKSNIGHLEGTAAMIAMVKCVVLVYRSYAPPTIHFRTLNPHLEHTNFQCFFCTETNPYRYTRGHCQVSSFGVGGTNGHAIFWGENMKLLTEKPDYKELFMRKMNTQKNVIKAEGSDPSSWTLTGPDTKSKLGEKYDVVMEKDFLTDETKIRWVKAEEEEEKKPPEFFSMTGNFNNWVDERMEDGEVPGLFYKNVEVPQEGLLQFRFMADADSKRMFGPTEDTARKNSPMTDESATCTTFWSIRDIPGELYRVELMAPGKGVKTVQWFRIDIPE
mmetsp:Transcript_157147/g.286121  ORF Transcript_157147/g.286121 Transcript_157147/m.286121 type:complete len:932 (+) Transcript_157147:83-2878(+)